ncbi:hypothetical protein D3C77_564620 [compost metagenome]
MQHFLTQGISIRHVRDITALVGEVRIQRSRSLRQRKGRTAFNPHLNTACLGAPVVHPGTGAGRETQGVGFCRYGIGGGVALVRGPGYFLMQRVEQVVLLAVPAADLQLQAAQRTRLAPFSDRLLDVFNQVSGQLLVERFASHNPR